jgi:hypothetical protein
MSARPPGCACTPTRTASATAITRSAPAFRSSTARPRGWCSLLGYPRWCGGPAWTSTRLTSPIPPTSRGSRPSSGPSTHRRARLRAAAALATAEPPLLVRGDLVDDLPALAAQAPAGATLVVFHTSVLYQVPPPRSRAFATVVRALPGHWIANEGPDVLTYDTLRAPPDAAHRNVLALDGTPLAWTSAHGQSMTWLG